MYQKYFSIHLSLTSIITSNHEWVDLYHSGIVINEQLVKLDHLLSSLETEEQVANANNLWN